MGKAIDNEPSLTRLVPASRFGLGRFWRHTTEGETGYSASPYEALRDALARENILHRRMQSAMQEYEILRQESDHRLSNNLQMVVSLLMKQSRSATPESAPQLAAAAQRVMAIERTHRHLHSNDGSETVAFRIYLETLCADISGIINTEDGPGRDILVTCDDICFPTKISIALGFIISELVTNAVKYGNGGIRVRLHCRPDATCALTVANDGPALPEGYDPAASKGLGIKIVRAFVRQIGGELEFGRDDGNQGAQFTVLFPDCR